MTINKIDFDFDSTTLEGIEKIDMAKKGIEKLQTDIANEKGSLLKVAKRTIKAFRDFFQEISGKDIVGDCNSPYLAKCYFDDFNKQCEAQQKKLREDYFK